MEIREIVLESIREALGQFGDIALIAALIVVPAGVLYVLYLLWINHIVGGYFSKYKYALLSINVPSELERTPKVAEVIMYGLWSIKTSPNMVEKYFTGKRQDWFSLEIVSINGEVRYLIRTPVKYKDLVEANVYAQYPEAEIAEIRDYVDFAPDQYPDNTYDIFAAEYALAKEDGYPIRTYRSFEGPTPETTVDPLATLLEVMGNIGQGEQIWYQIVAKPVGSDWKKEGEAIVNKLIGKKVKKKTTLIGDLFRGFSKEFGDIAKSLPLAALQSPEFGDAKPSGGDDKTPPSLIQYLSPGEIEVVKAIQENIAKPAFECHIRWVYIATKDKYGKNVKARVNGIRSGMETPFQSNFLNGFVMKKELRTKVDYFARFRVPRRQRILMNKYKTREFVDKGMVLNTEELATIFHFPDISVKTATLRRAQAKKGDAPADLPLDIPFE